MRLIIHSDASYLNEHNARSNYGGYSFPQMVSTRLCAPTTLNGCLLATVGLLKRIAASASKYELGGIFCNAQDGTTLHLTLNKMGHQQTEATPIYVDNTTDIGIANTSIKKLWRRAMNMHYFWGRWTRPPSVIFM